MVTRDRSQFIARAEPIVSRTFASGTRSGDRSDRTVPPWSGYRALGACSSVAGHRSPRKPAATRDPEPTRRADAPPDHVPSASSSTRLPIPLLRPRARKRARTPRVQPDRGRGHQAGGITPVEQHAGPAVKTSSPRLPPRDAERAVGGIRAWGENPGRRASLPTTVLLFGPVACPALKKSARVSPRASADSPPAAARPDSHRPCPPRNRGARPRREQTAIAKAAVPSHRRRCQARGPEEPAFRPGEVGAESAAAPAPPLTRSVEPPFPGSSDYSVGTVAITSSMSTVLRRDDRNSSISTLSIEPSEVPPSWGCSSQRHRPRPPS